jgi:thymidine phosphorylase
MHAKPGDVVAAGSALYTLHTDTPAAFARAQESLTNSVTIGDLPKDGKIDRLPLVVERITD